ncbi:hypothetical protein B7755_018965 [Streptomyces sp. NBS 14/10]|uniref:hypothetical protein n=1 Tax=Streptomyces sp. NBS 14/10 TaxID=1945643 RepID=UPI0015C5FFC3|nr:hypothetical protein [Streptomyces sp. NBS 14/10]KAK1180044.1 hypothetical protein B7755_018965 [Streptomyces sp. NBS 14/10]NUS87241.1 hypothetical protein [Streptomyces sp.]
MLAWRFGMSRGLTLLIVIPSPLAATSAEGVVVLEARDGVLGDGVTLADPPAPLMATVARQVGGQ